MGFFEDLFTNQPQKDAAQKQTAGYNAGYSQLSDQFGQGRDALKTTVQPGIDMFSKLFDAGQAGSSSYADATGVNGQGGLDKARSLFTQTPGYTEGLNLALDQNDRRAASRGMLSSGNTLADTTRLSNDYAGQKYGDYVNRLQLYPGATTSAAAGAGNLYSTLGDSLNKSFMNQGGAANAAQVGIGDANAKAELARTGAAGNLFGALLDVGGMALGVPGVGSGFSKLFGAGGGAGAPLNLGNPGGTSGLLGALY